MRKFALLAAVALCLFTEYAASAPLAVDLNKGQSTGLAKDDRGRLRITKGDDGFHQRGEFISATIDLKDAGPVIINWLEQWTSPQTWKKHSGNPIFGPKQTGKWDGWTNGVSIIRNADNKTYKMFYSGKGGIGFADGSIDDPLTWTENPASPVLTQKSDTWEGNRINQPRVVKVTEDHWRMYYTGWGFKGEGTTWACGLAESHDAGVTWKRVSDEPIIPREPKGSFDDGGACVPHVLKVGDKWMMWYTAMKIIPSRQSIHLCLATSDDGVHWTKSDKNPVISDDFTTGPNRNVSSRCHVRYDDGVFRLWYSHAKPDYRIRYAESLDGAEWEHSPIHLALDASKEGWDSKMVEYPTIDIVDGKWRLWFCGNGFGSVGYADGVIETGVKLAQRSGPTPDPDKSWSDWQPVTRDSKTNAGRYVQVKAELWSENKELSPALNKIEIVK